MAKTKVIKQVLSIQLLHEAIMNMYVVTDGIHHSMWMNEHEKDELLTLSDSEFVIECERIIEEGNY